MTEEEGCALLRERFCAAGLAIEDNYRFAEGEGALSIDGFDPGRRIGYEYITTAAGDRAEITPALVAALEERMSHGELYVLLVDELDAPSADVLTHAADQFLNVLRVRGMLPTPPDPV